MGTNQNYIIKLVILASTVAEKFAVLKHEIKLDLRKYVLLIHDSEMRSLRQLVRRIFKPTLFNVPINFRTRLNSLKITSNA